MSTNVFGFVKELNDVGKDLPTRAGESEANREKNRYPYILPCKWKSEKSQITANMCDNVWDFSLLFIVYIDDHCRVRLSIQNSQPHTDYINANFVPVRTQFTLSLVFITLSFCFTACLSVSTHLSASVNDRVSVFRVEDRRETSSALRVLCTTQLLTSGGWCGSKMSG